MSDYKFKRFTKIGSKLGNYSISLTGSHSFGFSSGFYNREGISRYNKVVLFYDKSRKAVGFQFTNDKDAEGAFTIIHGNKRTTGSVTVRSFLISNEINKEEYVGRKTPTKVKDGEFGEIFVIDLLENNK
ncbi:MAG TPA: hypothetical protein VIH52_01035 [Candidatus Nanoarchaeia archaeon]